MKRSFWSSLLVIAALVALTAGSIAGGTLGGSWSRFGAGGGAPMLSIEGIDVPAADPGALYKPLAAKPPKGVTPCSAPCLGTGLTFSGQATGIGSTNGSVNVEGAGYPVIVCKNGGKVRNASPGINKDPILSGNQSSFNSSQVDQNGKLLIPGLGMQVDLSQLPAPDPTVYCPNANWTAQITNIRWTEGKVYLIQDGVTACNLSIFEGTGGLLTAC